MNNSDAMGAYWKEWTNLEAKGVYRWDTLVEWSDVSCEARWHDTQVHLAFLFGFMIEKGAEYEPWGPSEEVQIPSGPAGKRHQRSVL